MGVILSESRAAGRAEGSAVAVPLLPAPQPRTQHPARTAFIAKTKVVIPFSLKTVILSESRFSEDESKDLHLFFTLSTKNERGRGDLINIAFAGRNEIVVAEAKTPRGAERFSAFLLGLRKQLLVLIDFASAAWRESHRSAFARDSSLRRGQGRPGQFL
jgi:hypothetical protein